MSPQQLGLFILLMIFLISFIQVGALSLAFNKLGLSMESAFLLLMLSLSGSLVNLPLFKISATAPQNPIGFKPFGLLRPRPIPFQGFTVVSLNVGGGLVPIVFSIYLMAHSQLAFNELVIIILLVSGISFFISRPIHGIGIGMPIFIAPIFTALISLSLNPEQAAPLAYVGGTMGVLIGADLLRLKDIRTMGTPIASIGGAGTFDGIFITGIVAVLLT